MSLKTVLIKIIIGVVIFGGVTGGLVVYSVAAAGNRSSGDSENDSPEIYFHRDDDGEDRANSPEIFLRDGAQLSIDVKVWVSGGVATTIPEVEMTHTAVWEDVLINSDGTCSFEGKNYPYLYYEGNWEYPGSSFGWMVEKKDGVNYIGGTPVDHEDICDFITDKCLESGLEPNEAQVIIDRIEKFDMLEFDSPYLAIRYIPQEDVDTTMTIETSLECQVMRRHFYLEEMDEPMELSEPVYDIPTGGLRIHETAVNRA